MRGPFVPLAEQELDSHPVVRTGGFTASLNGTVVYQSTLDVSAKLLWFDPSGRPLGKFSDEAYQAPSFSPDGRYVAVISDDARNGRFAIRVHDLARGLSTRLTEPGDIFQPIWSPDGKLITYACQRALNPLSGAGGRLWAAEVVANGRFPGSLALVEGRASRVGDA